MQISQYSSPNCEDSTHKLKIYRNIRLLPSPNKRISIENRHKIAWMLHVLPPMIWLCERAMHCCWWCHVRSLWLRFPASTLGLHNRNVLTMRADHHSLCDGCKFFTVNSPSDKVDDPTLFFVPGTLLPVTRLIQFIFVIVSWGGCWATTRGSLIWCPFMIVLIKFFHFFYDASTDWLFGARESCTGSQEKWAHTIHLFFIFLLHRKFALI